MNDIELVRRAKSGDTESFARLYGAYYKDMYRFALYMLSKREDAEDAVAEATAQAYASIASLKDDNSFKSWIFAILSNKCKRILRRKYREVSADPANADAAGYDKECISEAQKDAVMLTAMSQVLSEEERSIILLHVFGGYKSDEIGSMLGLKASTVRSKEHRALKRLKGFAI